jgi:site-specific DNA-cytosine methylase
MVLRNGFAVRQYYYSDTDLTAQTVAIHRIISLQEQYPHLLPQQALLGCFSAMPADITAITAQHVYAAFQQHPSAQWLVVSGWPCQDFSLAGPSRGLSAARSQLLTELVRLIGVLQQLLPDRPPAYLLENVTLQHHRDSSISQQDFMQITHTIGQPIVLDAAQVGSFAHRLRNFWTNLCFPEQLQAAIQFIQRQPERVVSSILPAHRHPMPVVRTDRSPQYVCNVPGQPRQAWPTIMSRPGSYAFRSGQPGSVIDCSNPMQPHSSEPTAQERELAMGYMAGTTAAFGVTEAERCKVLGQCMDANTLQVLFALSEAIWNLTPRSSAATTRFFVSMEPVKQNCQLLSSISHDHQPYAQQQAVCMAAAAEEQAAVPSRGSGDVWEDPVVMQYLQTGELPHACARADFRRIQRRSKHYSFVGDKLTRVMPDATRKLVPPPADRQQLITKQHEQCGHSGMRKTAALLLTRFWWYGLLADVEHLVGNCEFCSRVDANFTAKPQELKSIPISSLAFRWHVDLAGPFPKSNRDNTYIMIAIEAFTKHLEVVPILNKEAATVAYAFLHHVIARFGAAGQVVTDAGTEFEGQFDTLLRDCMIDHVLISKGHPQANGQAERMVQTVKTALKKTCAAQKRVSDWDSEVAWIAMGYRCSPQSSTGYTPYEMLYGRKPVIPPAAADVLAPEIAYADPAAAAKDLLLRKEVIKQICPAAMENLAIAQHRDQLRYLRSRDPNYQPKVRHFHVGDFVHVQQQQRNSTLQPRAQPVIYRVKEVRDSGVLILQGKCGRTVSMHMSHCAPCHLQGISTAIDPRLTEDTDEVLCEVCGTDEQEDKLILCDICTSGYHLFCLTPALDSVPQGHWLCPNCLQQGLSVQDAQQREAEREHLAEEAAAPVLFPNAAMKKRDEAAAAKHGRLVQKLFDDPITGQVKPYWGRVHFQGALHRPNYYLIMYEDGDSQTMGNRQLNAILQDMDVVLPAGVTIPEPPATATAALAQHFAPRITQQVIRAQPGSVVAIPHCHIPGHDIMELSDKLIWQAWHDPITQYPGWIQLPFTLPVPNESWPNHQAKPVGTPIYLAPALQYVLQALHEAFKLRPVLIICYIPALQVPQPVWQLARIMVEQGTGALFQAAQGWWLIISRRPVPVHRWLRLDLQPTV